MAKSDTALTIAKVSARIKTVGQARACIGKATDLLSEGYDKLPDTPSGTVLGFFAGAGDSDDVRKAAQSLLDQANAYCKKIYDKLPSDDDSQTNVVDVLTAGQVGAALATSQSALKSVEQAAAEDYWDFFAALTEVLEAVGEAAGHVIAKTAAAAGAGLGALIKAAWWVFLILALVIGLLLYLRFRPTRRVAT
jgi:hypothetical protein